MASIPDPGGADGAATGPVVVTGYEVGSALREGWAGTIRAGRHLSSGRRVTIQTLRPDLSSNPLVIDRLAQAGREMASLRAPNLVGVYDVVEEGSAHHLVAEWTDAPTMERRLQGGPIDSAGVVAILDGVLAGLATLHRAGSFHGRVGPDTVVTEEDGTPRLAELAACAAAAPDGAGAAADVAAAARMGLELLPSRDVELDAVRGPLLAAATSGRGDAASLRRALTSAEADPVPGATTARVPVAPMPVRPRRGRRRLLLVLVALAAVVAGTVGGLLLSANRPVGTSHGPLSIGGDARLTVSPASAGCDTTFVFVARGSLSGTGSLTYSWEQSDGQVSAPTTLAVRADEGSFQLTQAWRLQGPQTVDGGMTLHLLAPVNRRLRQAFHYACS